MHYRQREEIKKLKSEIEWYRAYGAFINTNYSSIDAEACSYADGESDDDSYKNLHNINTFSCSDNEIYLSGTDENGDDLTIVLNAIEILQWLDMKYIKKQSIKYIKQL